MSGSTMFNVAYGLECDSNDDPILIRMDKLLTVLIHVSGAAQFLFVSLLLAYLYDKSPDLISLEYSPSFEACSVLDAWWLV
jgi:hypothetical protein